MNRRIITPRGTNQILAEALGVSRRSVSRALNFANNTALSRSIRNAAIQAGGRVVYPDIDLTEFLKKRPKQ